MSSDERVASDPSEGAAATDAVSPRRLSTRRLLVGLIVGVVLLDVLAFLFVPPYPAGQPGKSVSGISDLIMANLELPAPHVVIDFAPNDPVGSGTIVFFHPSISSPILTMWILMAVILGAAFFATRRMSLVPGPVQNAVELAYESLENWAVSLGGQEAVRHLPFFTAFFIFIVISNWSGLLPFFGKFEELRAPTSDVNVTIGLALVAFGYFHFQGFRTLGVRGYLGKFFVFSGFKNGLSNGLIDLFVGFTEFLLEFIKPVTLAMRLFGNIFGGEVALGVITALTIACVPALMLLLEGLLNLIQALIFSTLMLMYTIIAMEGHHSDEHVRPPFNDLPEGNMGPPLAAGQGAAH